MKRLLCLFLVVIMALTAFAGCKKESPNTPGTSDTDEETHTDTNGSENEEPKKSWKDLPKEKFNGEEYNILGRKHTPWGSDDLYATDTKTDLSAAVFARNSAVELRYGIIINVNMYDGPVNIVTAMDLADTSDYDLYDVTLGQWGRDLSTGCFQDLTKSDVLDLSDSWWDQRFIENLTIYDQLYGVLSDATYVDKMATWATIFNKDMVLAHNLDVDIYKLVEDGEWTFAKVLELAKRVNLDANEDGVMEIGGKDIYGIGGELANLDFLIQASGMPYAYYQDDKIVYSLVDRVLDFDGVFNAVYDLVADSTLTYMADAHTAGWSGGRKLFQQQQMLFYISGVLNLPVYFRGYEHDYGVVPMPKYTKEQTRYYNPVTTYNCPTLCVPRNAENTRMSMMILQALSCRGEETLIPVFYDNVLKYQASRDPQTWAMMDMIFEDRIFDLATIHNFGKLAGNVTSEIPKLVLEKRPGDFVSTVRANEGLATDAIDKLMKFYDSHYKPE